MDEDDVFLAELGADINAAPSIPLVKQEHGEDSAHVSTIRALDSESIHRICSGQVITDLSTAIKELLENSIDAHSTVIEVRCKNYGLDGFDIIDNGTGISSVDYQYVCKPHSTSKISAFEDLQSLASFGFRGEALSSLCAIADVVIVTKTQEDSIGVELKYDHNGNVVSQRSTPRMVGTTISVSELFTTLPVRRREYDKSHKKQYQQMVHLLQSYALISRGIHMTLIHSVSHKAKQTVFATNGTDDMKELITTIYGIKQSNAVMLVDKTLQSDDEFLLPIVKQNGSASAVYRLHGYISQLDPQCCRSSNDRVHLYINNRPVDFPKLSRAVNDCYRSVTSYSAYPFILLNLTLPPEIYDINVTPNKRQVFIQEEYSIIGLVKRHFTELFAPKQHHYVVQSMHNYLGLSQKDNGRSDKLSPIKLTQVTQPSLLGTPNADSDADAQTPSQSSASPLQATPASSPLSSPADSQATESESEDEAGTDAEYVAVKVEAADDDLFAEDTPATQSIPATMSMPALENATQVSRGIEAEPFMTVAMQDALGSSAGIERSCGPFLEYRKRRHNDGAAELTARSPKAKHAKAAAPTASPSVEDRVESHDSGDDGTASQGTSTPLEAQSSDAARCETLSVDWGMLDELYSIYNDDASDFSSTELATQEQSLADRLQAPAETAEFSPVEPVNLGLQLGINQRAQLNEQQMRRVVTKSDFQLMQVIGQFNLGFIIAKLHSDLFIIDQHASDEKYRFEQLQQHTVVQTQPLLKPLPLDLSAVEASVIRDNIEVFKANGFEITDSVSGGHQLQLTALPYSKQTVFGVNDVHQLCALINDSGDQGSDLPRIPKIISMFASRACRTAVMIGTSLDQATMKGIVQRMSETEHPWSCPHGRPTARHLVDMSMLTDDATQSDNPYDAAAWIKHSAATTDVASSPTQSTKRPSPDFPASQMTRAQPSQFRLAVSIR